MDLLELVMVPILGINNRGHSRVQSIKIQCVEHSDDYLPKSYQVSKEYNAYLSNHHQIAITKLIRVALIALGFLTQYIIVIVKIRVCVKRKAAKTHIIIWSFQS